MPKLRMGGQAVLEGVMMRSPHAMAVAVRRPDGTITTTASRIDTVFHKYFPFTWFPLRGVVSLIEMFTLGLKALSFSAQQATGEEEDFGAKEIAGSFIFAMVLVVLLFIVLPAFLANFTKSYLPSSAWKSGVEGVIRISIFLIYVWAVSYMRDIKRVFEYHGAEHKTVHAYEEGMELKPEVIRGFSALHVGCGTGFLLIVMVVSIFVFAFIPPTTIWLRVLIQICLVPVIGSFTYELIRLARRYEHSTAVKILMAPGLLLQRLTAREPDDDQIEVAVTALEEALKMEGAPAGAHTDGSASGGGAEDA
ncbi:MAG: DUF1385 domain-containing protein [Actinomycetota bacterium]